MREGTAKLRSGRIFNSDESAPARHPLLTPALTSLFLDILAGERRGRGKRHGSLAETRAGENADDCGVLHIPTVWSPMTTVSPYLSSGEGSFAVATPHWAATDAACASWRSGGNAVDAALAASAVLAVVYPHMCGLGGDLFGIVADAHSQTVVNGSGAYAETVEVESMRRQHIDMPVHGPLSVTVPGVVAAWGELARRFGRRPLSRAIEPALELAERGIPTAPSLGRAISSERMRLESDPGLRELFIPLGKPLGSGDQLVQPKLARTLRTLMIEGSRAMYDGQLAAGLVDYLARMGSALSAQDFRHHHTEVCPPLRARYREHEVLVPPPNSQGFLLPEILSCIERSGMPANHLGEGAATVAQVYLATAADRDHFLADPRRVKVPIDRFLSVAHTKDILARRYPALETVPDRKLGLGDTVGIVVGERDGLWVSINQSLYDSFGAGILEPSSGVIYQNRGSAFSLDLTAANALSGATRPPHTLLPVIVLRSGSPVLGSATMGGSAHAQIHSQILMAILDRHMSPSEAVDSPRWLVGGVKQGAGATVVAEARVPETVIARLKASGLVVRSLGDWDELVGHAQVVSYGSNNSLSAGSDRRADGAAAVLGEGDRTFQ